MRIKKIVLVLLIIVFVGLIAGCTSEKSTGNNSSKTIRIAYFPNITHSQALVGKEQGVFQKDLGSSWKVEWMQFNAGSLEVEALLTGTVDIGYIGPVPAINAYVKTRGDVQIIAGASDAGAILVSRKGLTIKDIKDLDGKKIAVPQFGATQDLTLRNLLAENGLKDKVKGGTVEILQSDNPDIKTLMANGNIDAALVPEPWGSRLIKETGANLVLDFDKLWREGKYPTAVVVARKDFIKENPEAVEKFLKAHVELTDYINKNNDDAKKLVNKQLDNLTKKPLSKDILDSSFKRLTVNYDPKKEAIKEMVNLSVNTGFLKVQPKVDTLFNLELLNKVLKEKNQQQIK